jgi:hypothetical protein
MSATNLVGKTVKMKLVGLDGNAWVLLGRFSRVAGEQGWTEDEIKTVTDEAMNGDYNHLLRTLATHTDDGKKAKK